MENSFEVEMDFSDLELDWEIDEDFDDSDFMDYEESDDEYQERLERSWAKYEND
jgi:hypothetical protein